MAKSSIEKIWVVGSRADGCVNGTTLLFKDKKKKRKKQLKFLRPLEKTVRMGSKSGKNFFDHYQDKHNKSNRKKRNGWLGDFPVNTMRANSKAIKAIKVTRIFGM